MNVVPSPRTAKEVSPRVAFAIVGRSGTWKLASNETTKVHGERYLRVVDEHGNEEMVHWDTRVEVLHGDVD